MEKTKSLNVLDVIATFGSDAVQKVDDLGYELLASCGYNVKCAKTDSKKREKIRRAMKRRGETLFHHGTIDDNGTLLFWYTLKRGHETVAKSPGIKFVMKGGRE